MKSLRRIMAFVQPYWRAALVGVLLVILSVAMELAVPRLLQFVIDKGITARDMTAIVRGSLLMLCVALAGAVATVGQAVCRARLSQGMAYDIRNDLFMRIQTLSFGNLDHMQTGQLMTRLSSDVDMVRMFAGTGLALIIRAGLLMVGSLVLLIITDWQLALIMLVLMPAAAAVFWGFVRVASPLFTVIQQKLASLNTIAQENLTGVEVVKAFVRERFEIGRFEDGNDDYMKENVKAGRLLAVAFPTLLLLTNLGTLAVIWLGGMQVIGGRLSVGELVAFNNYLLTAMFPLLMLGMLIMMMSRAEASAERVMEILDTEALVFNRPSAVDLGTIAGRVTFENVSFRYNGNSGEDVLHGVSLVVEPGQRVALLGATGSGKSTLVNLIPRFYDVTGGRLSVDGRDVRDVTLDSLRSQVGMVLQQTTVFSGTVRQNIAYGKPGASLDEIVAAAKAAQAHEFVVQMPDGYDSQVEARGANLSGGQKQRIAIARALLIEPAILILDDSTSAVDVETEFRIQQALDELMAKCTTFIIAQRISSVLNMDQILVLSQGNIAARGTHQELLHDSPIYQEIYHTQLSEDGPPRRQSAPSDGAEQPPTGGHS